MNKKVLLSTVAVGVVAAGGVFAWNQYAQVKIREVVDASFERAEAYFAAMNVQAEFTYEDVTVSTFRLNPHASVHKVRLELSSPEGGGDEMAFTVPEMVYKPKNLTLSAYELELLDAISVQTKDVNGQTEHGLIEFGANPRMVVDEERDRAVAYDLNLSDRIEFIPVDAEGNREEGGNHVKIAFAATPEVKWAYNAQGLLTLKKAVVPATVVEMAGEKLVQWTSLQGKVEYEYPDGAELGFYAVGEAQEFQLFTPEWQRVNPVNAAYELSYLGADITNPESGGADGKVELKSFSFVSPVVSLFSNGEFNFDLNENSLPVGLVNLRIDQLDKFLPFLAELEDFGEGFNPVAREYLGQLQGVPVEGDSVSFAISREDGGRVYIGKLNLEDAIGSGLQALFKLHQAKESGKKVTESQEGEAPVDEVEPAQEKTQGKAAPSEPKKESKPEKKVVAPKPVKPEVPEAEKASSAEKPALPVTVTETPLTGAAKEEKAPSSEAVVIDTPSAEVTVEVTEKDAEAQGQTELSPAPEQAPAQ